MRVTELVNTADYGVIMRNGGFMVDKPQLIRVKSRELGVIIEKARQLKALGVAG